MRNGPAGYQLFTPKYAKYLPPHIRFGLCIFFALLVFGYSRGLGLALFDDAEAESRGPIFFASVLVSIGFIVTALRFRKTGLCSDFYFRLILFSYVAIGFADIAGGVRVYHQPLVGVLRDFFWYAGLLAFPVFFMWRGDIRLVKQFLIIFLGFSVISVVLCDLASFVPQLRSALSTGTQSERFGLARIRSIETVPFAFFYFLVTLTKERHSFLKHIGVGICFGLVVFNIFYVSMTRQIIISILLTCLYYFVKYFRFKINPMHICVVVLLVACALVINVDLVNVVSNTIASFGSNADTVDKNNVDVRMKSAIFYFQQFKATNYLGIGKISTVFATDNPIAMAMEDDHYFLADLGLLAVLYQYGLPAIFLLIRFFARAFKDLFQIIKVAPCDLAAIAIAIELSLVSDLVRFWFMYFRNDLCFIYAFYFFLITRILNHLRYDASTSVALISSLPVSEGLLHPTPSHIIPGKCNL